MLLQSLHYMEKIYEKLNIVGSSCSYTWIVLHPGWTISHLQGPSHTINGPDSCVPNKVTFINIFSQYLEIKQNSWAM